MWIGYGVFQSRRSNLIREQVGGMGRAQRGITGSLLFLVGAMVLIGGLAIVMQQGGFTSSGMTPLAWLNVTFLGLAFVHAQTMGMAMLVSLVHQNVTNAAAAASINKAPGEHPQQ
jgi:hypothetical protein